MSRVQDLAEYCYIKGYTIDDAILVIKKQLRKEGLETPTDKELESYVCDVYDEMGYDRENL